MNNNTQDQINKASKMLAGIVARGHRKSDVAVVARVNDVSYYDIVLVPVGESDIAEAMLHEHATDIGSHAEARANEIAKAIGCLTEAQADKAESEMD